MSYHRKEMNGSILIVGTGALATLFAARLSKADINVSIMGTWQAGLDALEKKGARLDQIAGKIVRVGSNPLDFGEVDYALVLVKSWQTESAGRQLEKCLARDGLVVTLQNGLGNEEILAKILSKTRVVRGVTTIGATLLGPGFAHLGGDGKVMLEKSLQMGRLEEMLRKADFQTEIYEDIESQVWGKLVLNAAINPMTALLGVKNADLLKIPSALILMKEIADEAIAVSEAVSIKLPFKDGIRTIKEVARRSGDNLSSMLQDVRRGAQTEVDSINGKIVNLGEIHQVPTIINRSIWLLIHSLSERGKINGIIAGSSEEKYNA